MSFTGAPTTVTRFKILSKTIVEVLTCQQFGIFTLQPGVYSTSPSLTADEISKVTKKLAEQNLSKKDYLIADNSKCSKQ